MVESDPLVSRILALNYGCEDGQMIHIFLSMSYALK